MSEAWKLLDLYYGNLQEVRAKLKEQVRSLKLKATSDPAKIVELFQQVQIIAAKIKATGSISLLKMMKSMSPWLENISQEKSCGSGGNPRSLAGRTSICSWRI